MPARATDDPLGLDPVVTWDEALAAGLTPGQINHRVRTGRWRTVGRGIYLRYPSDTGTLESRRAAHVHRSVAAALGRQGSAVCLGSAALLHGLPTVGVPELVELMVPPGGWAGRRDGVRSRVAEWAEADVCVIPRLGDGVAQVTTPARTVVDIARTHPLAEALMAGDHALREGSASVDDIAGALARAGGRRGLARAREACLLFDARRESPLESASWARFLEFGIPLPSMQVALYDARGFIARVDFYREEFGLVGEADGVGKFAAGADLLHRTLMRHDRIVGSGLRVVRWGWPDAYPTGDGLRRLLTPLLTRVA